MESPASRKEVINDHSVPAGPNSPQPTDHPDVPLDLIKASGAFAQGLRDSQGLSIAALQALRIPEFDEEVTIDLRHNINHRSKVLFGFLGHRLANHFAEIAICELIHHEIQPNPRLRELPALQLADSPKR